MSKNEDLATLAQNLADPLWPWMQARIPIYLPWTQRALNPFPLASSSSVWGDMGEPWAIQILAFYVTVFVSTTNSGVNFWTVNLCNSTAVVIASVSTSAIAANSSVRLSTTTITQPGASDPVLLIIPVATGSPGSIFIWPAVPVIHA